MFKDPRVTRHTRSCHPIFQSSMTWIARAPLVIAVSSAGVMDLLENSIAATGSQSNMAISILQD
jgi:enoyl-[acyl-carrier protein] reductase II